MPEPERKEKRLFCPYCDEEIMGAGLSYCQACGVTVFYCPQCRKSVARDKKVCPHCGAEIRGEKD